MNTSGMHRQRWLLAAGAAAAILAATGLWGWFVWLPGYRPALGQGELYGIDVSAHQGRIDWVEVAGDGISFAYIKATEGGDFVDDRLTENWRDAGAAGLRRGAYHFFTLCTPGDQQARNFLDAVPDDPGALPPAVDLEIAGNCSARPDAATVGRELKTFLALVEAPGGTAVLYVGADFESMYPVRSSLPRPLWVRRVLRRPDDDGWVVWQVGGFAHVAGIDGRVDLDVFRTSIEGP
jgi:lysozyme